MDTTWLSGEAWLARTLGAGGSILLLGQILIWRLRQPARRQRLAELALVTSLIIAILAALPAWWSPADWFQASQAKPMSATPSAPLVLPAALLMAPPEPQEIVEMPLAFASIEPAVPVVTPWPVDLPPAEPAILTPGQALVAAYGILAAGFAGCLLLGYVGLRRLARQSRPVSPALERLLDQVLPAGQPRPRLRLHDRLTSPISFGLWQPTILLPAGFETSGSPVVRASVLAHELTHLARCDAWSSLLFGLGQVLYFPMPWFWTLRRQVRLAQEYIADAAAARFLSAVDYAQVLVDWSARCQRRPSPALARANGVFQSSSDLSRRVAMLLREETGEVERFCPRWWTMGAASLFLGVATIATGVNLQAEPPTPPAPPFIWVDGDADQYFLWIDADDESPRDPKKDKVERKVIVQAPPVQLQVERLDAAIKAISATLERLGDRADAETRKALEETKRQLEDLRRQWQARTAPLREGPAMAQAESAKAQARMLAEKKLRELRTQMEQLRKELGDESAEMKEARQKLLEELEKRYKETLERVKQEAEKARAQALELRGQFPLSGPYMLRLAPASRGRLGVQVEPVPAVLAAHLRLKENTGLVVAQVTKDSPAEKAGLKQYDIITEMNGQPVSGDVEVFRKTIHDLKPDAKVDFKVLREGKNVELRGIEVPAAKPEDEVYGMYMDGAGTVDLDSGTITELRTGPPLKFIGPMMARGVDQRDVTTTITLDKKNTFTINHSDGKVKITVTGQVEDGKARFSGITIRDGDQTTKFKSLDEVPNPHKETLEKLLKKLQLEGKPSDRD